METTSHQFAGALLRLGDDEQLFRELIAFFNEDAPTLLATIREGMAAGNDEAVARAAHSLRSLLANFDADNASAIAGTIEQMARKGEMRWISRVLGDLDAEVRILNQALKCFVAETPSTAVRK